MAGARQVVDAPSFTPIPFGLLSAVEFPPTSDDHWQNGVTYQPTCGVATTGLGSLTYDACLAVTGVGGSPPPPPSFTNTVSTTARGATPFAVWVEFECAAVGVADAQATAERALAMAEPWQVERAFWTGLAAGQTVVFPHLAANAQVLDAQGILLQTAAVNVTGTGVYVSGDKSNVEAALGLLEGALANCYDGVGVIHVPQMLVPTLDAWGVIRTQGGVMKTLNGNKVAVGAGYPGTGPDGATRLGNAVWMYATGNVFGYRSPVRILTPNDQEAARLDRSTNTRRLVAERTYVLGWDCCHFAALATLGVPGGT